MQFSRYLKVALTSLTLLAGSAQAAYNLRYTTIAPGAVTFTGNAIGLDYFRPNNNTPPTAAQAGAQSVGAFMAAGGAGAFGTHPVPTTGAWASNRSAAKLRIPAGATVLYAELIWGGTYQNGTQTALTTAVLNGPVGLKLGAGASEDISPDPTTAQVGAGATGVGYYVRSQNVTTKIQGLGAGVHDVSVGKIPALNAGSTANAGSDPGGSNSGGWTLAVAYKDTSKAEHKMNIYVGAEAVSGTTSVTEQVTGFCTAPSGAQSGRLLVSALEGDAGIAGDAFRFGATNPPAAGNNLSGSNNLATNFFAAQINDDLGVRDTTGTHGTLNKTPGSNLGPGRHGWDITNVALDSFLGANQTTAYAQAVTTGDAYMVTALGIQIKVGQPSFPTAVKTVDKTVAQIGDELLYTVTLDNSTGTAQATNVRFFDVIPPGTNFVAGSFTQGGTSLPAVDPTNAAGVPLPNINSGSSLVVTFKVKVNTVPARPAVASYVNSARWTYDYVPCAGQSIVNGERITNPVTTTIARLDAGKTVAPPTGAQAPGATLTYSITMKNDGAANSSGTTMADAIPANTTYVAGSTTLNGVAVPDVAGVMPFAAAAPVNSSGQAAGVIAVGATATVTFQVTINNTATGTIANSAVVDIDGPGVGNAPPVTTPPTSTTVQPTANVSITKSNSVSAVMTGSTTTYSITVSNAGPSVADNTVVQDPAVTGLSCTAVTCPPAGLTGGAVCPATLTIAALQGAGLVVPTLPAASSVKLDVVCNVTATGV